MIKFTHLKYCSWIILFTILFSCTKENSQANIKEQTIVEKEATPKKEPVIEINSDLDSTARKIQGYWVNHQYVKYLDKYGTVHQANKRQQDFQALYISPSSRKENIFEIQYINANYIEPYYIYSFIDSINKSYSQEVIFSQKRENTITHLNFENNILSIILESENKNQVFKFKKVNLNQEHDKSSWDNPSNATQYTNRRIIGHKTYNVLNKDGEIIQRNIVFNNKGGILNWNLFDRYSTTAYHATAILNHDRFILRNTKTKESTKWFYAIKNGENWKLFDEIDTGFDRISLPEKGELQYILKLVKD